MTTLARSLRRIGIAAAALACPLEASGGGLGVGLAFEAELEMEAAATVRGGVGRGPAGMVRGGFALAFDGADAEAPAWASPWRARASLYAIAGRQLTPTLTGSLAPVSGIEALPAVRLFELWAERDIGIGSLRLGQLAADAEFATSWAGGQMVSGTFGWFSGLAGALPSGGPAFPLAAPGLRLALGDPDGTGGGTGPGPALGLRLALFAGDPGGRAGAGTDPQRHNRHGLLFPTGGGRLLLAEAVAGARANDADADAPRDWAVKMGGFVHSARFDDQRFDSDGLPLGDPASSGEPRRRRGNHGAYAIAEAVLWRDADRAPRLVGATRGALFPDDRNAIAAYADATLVLLAPLPDRPDDRLTLGAAWSRIGGAARGRDADAARLAATGEPGRSREILVELGYGARFDISGRAVLVQPFLQWIGRPGAGAGQDALDGRPARDAVVTGIRLAATLF